MSEAPGSERLVAGRYRLLSPLGEGGMGVVWRARDDVLGREVAIKEVRAPAGLGGGGEQRLYTRLEREAWAAARISHRNVVTVYDVAMEDSRPWIVMELVRGLTLSDVLDAEGPMAPRRAAHIGAEILAALRAAHDAGVLHRDVKPANVLIANDGRVVLTDFGIATVEGTSNLTMTGELIGSPEFLAPERALGRTPGPASDLWSLGVLLYAAVEGNSPFRQNTPLSTLRAVVDGELPPPRRAGALAPVILGLLHKEPADRLSAVEAEHLLRVVGAGGVPHTTQPPPLVPYSPTVPGGSEGFGPPPVTAGMAADVRVNVREEPDRSRRAAVVLVAGVVSLLLAIGGLTWALVNKDDGDEPSGSVGGGPRTSVQASSSGAAPSNTKGGNGGNGGNGGTTAPPAQAVKVYAQTVRESYSGTCPPPKSDAPAFRATITVTRTPAAVEYRWATQNGTYGWDPRGTDTSGSDWKTLRFASGGGKEKQVNHVERTYKQGQTHRDRIRVEIRSPVEALSNWVDFSVTCKQETPTGEGSYSADTAVRRAR
ncbi:serine/threonine-protein kinase [Streptomyces sp. NPDC052236]|uniref:serine/threonine-protein kinase n=1 Tax=Streptomyces sp. NPDC052236 TaxID=3365686 RepID=UPI0037D406E2